MCYITIARVYILVCVRAKERLYDHKELFSYVSSSCVGDTKLRLCGYLDVDSR